MTKPKPSYAPVYAAIYPDLAKIARKHGYALAVHGSLQRDFDIIGIPWILHASDPADCVSTIVEEFDIQVVGDPTEHQHGRVVWTISIGHGECFLDLSFMPLKPPL